MSFLFGSSKAPSVQKVPAPAPAAVVAEEEKKKLMQGRTSKQTLLTGPQGLLNAAPVQRKTLLGE